MPLRLLWRNLLGHPIRSVLTTGSVAVAVMLISSIVAIALTMALKREHIESERRAI